MACLSLCICCLHLFFCFLVLYLCKRPFSNGLFLWGVLTDRIVISLGLSAGSLGVAHLVVAVTLLLWWLKCGALSAFKNLPHIKVWVCHVCVKIWKRYWRFSQEHYWTKTIEEHESPLSLLSLFILLCFSFASYFFLPSREIKISVQKVAKASHNVSGRVHVFVHVHCVQWCIDLWTCAERSNYHVALSSVNHPELK